MRKILPLVLLLLVQKALSQDYNPILTAMPTLQFAPDACGSGKGNVGVGTTPDIYSQHWNASKYSFMESTKGVAFSYTPWLSNLVSGINMFYTVGYFKFGSSEQNVVSASLRYFTTGSVDIPDLYGEFANTVSPHEFAIDVAYSHKLTPTFAGAVTLRYMHADYSTGMDDSSPGNAFAADISGYNRSYIYVGPLEMLFNIGFNLSNIGTKISYDGGTTSNFLPTNLGLGASLEYSFNDLNALRFGMDINKLLVPTPKLPDISETPEEAEERVQKYQDTSSIGGIFKSFGDAPGGFSEELKEIDLSSGVEYVYDSRFFVRSGYHYQNKYKGNNSFMSFGAGLHYEGFMLDVSYLVSTTSANPLDKTLRLSLGFDIDAIANMVRK